MNDTLNDALCDALILVAACIGALSILGVF